jgi:hypothetical protein
MSRVWPSGEQADNTQRSLSPRLLPSGDPHESQLRPAEEDDRTWRSWMTGARQRDVLRFVRSVGLPKVMLGRAKEV